MRAAIPDADKRKSEKASYRRTRRFGRARGQEGWFNIDRVMSLKFRAGQEPKGTGLAIRGVKDDLPVTFEPGGAVPGDRIVGVLIPAEGIRIFQIHSPRLKEFEHEGWIDVTWDIDPDTPERFPARINVIALNEPGTLAQIAQGYRGGGWQHRQRQDGAQSLRFHGNAYRARGLRPGASKPHHRGSS